MLLLSLGLGFKHRLLGEDAGAGARPPAPNLCFVEEMK